MWTSSGLRPHGPATRWCPVRTAGRLGGLLVGDGPRRAGGGAVVHPQPAADPGHPVPDPLDALDEDPVEDHGHGVGVLPQVDEFVVGVAVVGVDRDEAALVGGEGRLEVLGAVVEVEGDLVLLADVGAQQPPATLSARRSNSRQVRCGPVDEGRGVRLHVGHGLPHVAEVPLAHVDSSLPRDRAPAPLAPWPATAGRRRRPSGRGPDGDRSSLRWPPWTAHRPPRTTRRPPALRALARGDHPDPDRPPTGRAGPGGTPLAGPLGPRRRPGTPARGGRGAPPGRGAAPREHHRHRLGRPHPPPCRHRGAEGAVPAPAAGRRGDLVPAVQRARRRFGPRLADHPGRARR